MKTRLEKMKEELVGLIEMHKSSWVKAAFFGDEDVDRLMKSLYSRWEATGRVGTPLDHASERELEELLRAAKRYASLSDGEAARIVIKRLLREEGLLRSV